MCQVVDEVRQGSGRADKAEDAQEKVPSAQGKFPVEWLAVLHDFCANRNHEIVENADGQWQDRPRAPGEFEEGSGHEIPLEVKDEGERLRQQVANRSHRHD